MGELVAGATAVTRRSIWRTLVWRFLAVVATQGLTHCGLVKPIEAPGARSFFPPRRPGKCLPPLVEVDVVRPRGEVPGTAGGGPPRSGRSTLTSPQRRKDRQLRGGMVAGTSESPSGTFCEEVPMIPEGLSWGEAFAR